LKDRDTNAMFPYRWRSAWWKRHLMRSMEAYSVGYMQSADNGAVN